MALKPKTKQLIWSLVTLVVLAGLTALINATGGDSGDGWVADPGSTRGSASSMVVGNPPTFAPSAEVSAPASSPVADDPPTGTDPDSGLPWVSPADLPPEARDTLELIAAGGPYPFPRNDDQTFGNREGILPDRPNGYYREYTVITPGSDDRGARRLVAGDRGELYYTDDHYDSFRRVAEAG